MCSNVGDDFSLQDVVLLEILFHIVKGVNVQKLFMDDTQRNANGGNGLGVILKKEALAKREYSKNAPTRHGRFGTMIWVKKDEHKVATVAGQSSITNASSTLQQMDASKKYNKPKYRGKQTVELNESEDFGGRVDLSEAAREAIRG